MSTEDTCPRCGEAPKAHRPTLGCPYNGWTNYETWAVKLWMDNEQSSQEYWADMAQGAQKYAPRAEQVRDGIWTVEQAARFQLAALLKDHFEEAAQGVLGRHQASMWADLLGAALQEVDWNEIAAALLADTK